MATVKTALEIPGWFPATNRVKLYELIQRFDIRSVIEIGSFLGLSTQFLASYVNEVQCVDRFEDKVPDDFPPTKSHGKMLAQYAPECVKAGQCNRWYRVFRKNMIEAGVWDKIVPIIGEAEDVARYVEPADLVYIDADHSVNACRMHCIIYGAKARKIVCGDDFDRESVQEALSQVFPGVCYCNSFWWYEKISVDTLCLQV